MGTLLTQIELAGTPLLTNDRVTFVWRGDPAPSVIGDFTNWGIDHPSVEMQQVEPHVWSATVSLPQDAYVEYAFVFNGGRFPDPLNSRTVEDGMGHVNSYFWMPNARETSLIHLREDSMHGRLTEHLLPSAGLVIGEARQVFLYQPPVEHSCPLVVVFDGQDYLHHAHLPTIVDNLISENRIQPIALALIANGGAARLVEYACSDTTLAFVVYHVLPFAQKHLQIVDVAASAGAYGILGASMGGLMGLYASVRVPSIFGHVLCESGAFGADHPAHRLYYHSVLEDLLELRPVPALKIWMDVGQQEWFLGANRQMSTRLRERGYAVTYLEHSSGHNYPSWRNVVWKGLEHLFGR